MISSSKEEDNVARPPVQGYLRTWKGGRMERTLVILKPNAIQRELVGEIIARFERRGMKITAMKFCRVPREKAEEHYREHRGRDFYEDLISFMTSGPSVFMILESLQAIRIVRSMVGDTDPAEAVPGSIRGIYATSSGHNMIHASDSAEAAEREIELFFSPEEIVDYTLSVRPWL